jgi:hypothetical protein
MKRSQRLGGGSAKKNRQGKSRYAAKKEQGDMMYGPGCCAHTVSAAQVAAAKQRARSEGHLHESFGRPQETM